MVRIVTEMLLMEAKISGHRVARCGVRVAGCELRGAGCGLRGAGC